MSKKLIGYVGVDTGQIVIADPCYAGDASCEVFERAEANQFGEAQLTGESGGHQFYEGKMAVVSSTGWGDGIYPVYAHYDEEGRVKRLTIDFL